MLVIILFSGCKAQNDRMVVNKKEPNTNINEPVPSRVDTVKTLEPELKRTPKVESKKVTTDSSETNTEIIKTLTLKDKINSQMPEFTFKVLVKKGDLLLSESYSPYKINITNQNAEKIQELLLGYTNTLDSERFGVYIEDMNFDGYKDIRVQCGTPPGPNIPYHYWLWDIKSSKYVQNEKFEEITSPSFDYENKTITSFNRGSASENLECVYKFIDHKLVLIKSIERIGNSEINGWHIIVRELVDGEMKVVKEYDESFK